MYSLPEWAFYLLSSAIIGGMIVFGLSGSDYVYRSAEDIAAEGVVYEGAALGGITLGPGLSSSFLNEGNFEYSQISASRGPLDGPQSAGAFIALSPQELSALQGNVVRVTYRMRSARIHGAQNALLSFFTPGVGQDSWQQIDLNEEYSNYSLLITPPQCEWANAYIGLWPSWDDGANSIEIESIAIEIVEAQTC